MRVEPSALDQLLHPTIDPSAEKLLITRGLAASPGAACGEIVLSPDEAEALKGKGREVILVRIETSPEDIHGMHAAAGILTARGGMTSHAAVVARGMGRPCVCGAGQLRIDYAAGTVTVGKKVLKVGDVITIDGATGEVIEGRVTMRQPELSGDFGTLMGWADKARRLKVRANADTPRDAEQARRFGAEGIGLCRTEHMFFEADRILAMREMICADDENGRRAALAKILPMQRRDFEALFEIMAGLPVTIRLLDPPLHEFLPHARGGAGDGGQGARRAGQAAEGARRGAARVQPDARLPRLPARHPLSRDRRDAGARDLRGGGECGEEDRQAGGAGGDDPAHRLPLGVRCGACRDRADRGGCRCRDEGEDRVSGRHHDRVAARRAAGGGDRGGRCTARSSSRSAPTT